MAHSVDKEQLSALLDGELNDAAREAALTHLDGCAACRAYLAELTALRDALGDMEEIDVPDGFAEGVMARVRGETARRRKTRRAWRAWAALAASAAAVALLVNVIPRGGSSASRTAASGAEAPRMTVAAPAASAAPSPSEAEIPAEFAETTAETTADTEALLETQMLFMSGGASNAPAEAKRSMDALAAMPGAAYDAAEESAAPDETGAAVERTLYGVGAEAWLTEHGWQGESGDWYADADDLRALPEGLTLTVPLPDGFAGDVRVFTEEPEIVEEAVEEPVEETAEAVETASAEEVAP